MPINSAYIGPFGALGLFLHDYPTMTACYSHQQRPTHKTEMLQINPGGNPGTHDDHTVRLEHLPPTKTSNLKCFVVAWQWGPSGSALRMASAGWIAMVVTAVGDGKACLGEHGFRVKGLRPPITPATP